MENISDHNREEAFKAKEITALESMEKKDFRHAQQIILGAQALCPELAENMSQMLIICDIHCAAESFVGGEIDFYGILQVEETADETIITKQYRRIALSTHPDKNSFAGAQDAFKLVAEAYSVLSDPVKPTEHDMKRMYRSQNVPKETNKNKPSKKTDADKGSESGSSETFWTNCPHCKYRFQYIKEVLNRRVVCQTCKKKFTASRIEDQEPPTPEHDWKRKNGTQNVTKETNKRKPEEPMPTSSSMISDSQVPETMFQEQQHETPSQQGHAVNSSRAYKEGNESAGGVNQSNKPETVQGNTRIPEIDKNIVGRSMADTFHSNVVDKLNKLGREQASTMPGSGSCSRGSSNQRKQHVDGKLSQNSSDGKKRERENDYSCNISMNSNQILGGDITSADRQSSENPVSSNINIHEITEGMCTSDDEDNIMTEAIDFVIEDECYSEPVMKIRDINSITYNDGSADQIWALYDNIDHMPRSYAKKKCDGHSKCLYWLKFYPLSEEEKEWNNKTLPVACGKFCLGEKVDILEYSSLYSHTVEWKKICVKKLSGGRGSAKTKMTMVYEIFPKRAEVWALYKGWSKQWSSTDAYKNRSYEYEVVEILSDMSDNGGANVIPLIRIKGFPSLLVAAKDKSTFHIPSGEVFRFSHRIPHYRVFGHENILKKNQWPCIGEKSYCSRRISAT
ncbi:hypothetical protein BDA96_05G165200 [Sorghum bicolor]|uniref:J domain-containing protein n=2 Tax=Sorghum bicolor TaxID=4558 RepID=A0A921UFN8_SORBI|nr:hypothetical protein SORBI_3005G151400 [Sorghum bicolor]KAG0530202.1 hypothetical protein BDA96_05G165200 [Sorghum bicolor]